MPDETTTPDPTPITAPTPADYTDPANLPDTVEALQDAIHSLTGLMAIHSTSIANLDGFISGMMLIEVFGRLANNDTSAIRENIARAKERRLGHYNDHALAFAQRSALYDRLHKLTNPPAPCPEPPDPRTL